MAMDRMNLVAVAALSRKRMRDVIKLSEADVARGLKGNDWGPVIKQSGNDNAFWTVGLEYK